MMIIKQGQTIFDIAIQEYGSIEDVFKILEANAIVLPNGLSTQLQGGDELQLSTESSQPKIQAWYKETNRKVSTGEAAGSSIEILSAAINEAYVGEDIQAVSQIKNTDLRPAIGEIVFDWGFSVTHKVAVFLVPGQEIAISDSITATADMLGTHSLQINGVANYSLSYKVKGKSEFVQSNALLMSIGSNIQMYDSNIFIRANTLQALGTASLALVNNVIVATNAGTVFDLQFQDSTGNSYRFPVSEGKGWTIHDTKQGKRAIIGGQYAWVKQNNFHWNVMHGATALDNGIYVPYNGLKQKIYNDF